MVIEIKLKIQFVQFSDNMADLVDGTSGEDKIFTLEDMKKAYNGGMRNGSVSGMKLARGAELTVKVFETWYTDKFNKED